MLDNQLNYKELEGLSDAEKQAVLKILQEYSDNGSSDTYNDILYSDYDEIPVSIDEFLHNPVYLGKGLINEEGKFTVYPYWVDTLKKIFPDPLQPSKYNTLALTGAIGLGKSFEAVLCCLYELYRMLCLKDPYLYYGLQPIDKITFALMNITLDAAQGVAWDKLQQLVQSSEWFMNHGTVSKGMNPVWKPEKKIELICGSQSRHIIGRAVFFAFFDEVSFQPNMDVGKQKEKAKNLVNTAAARMQSRFMKGEYNPKDKSSFTPALCNRIDRNTGGIVIAAKDAEALRVMNEKIKLREIDKFYLAAVHGIPKKKEDTIYGYLLKDEKTNTVRIYDKNPPRNAKKIATRYRVIAQNADTALLEVELLTGRTHQIRAHLAHIGHPLVGDGKYGINKSDRKVGYKHQALYSYRLRFSFKGEKTVLDYLNGKEFKIDKRDIYFTKDYFE